MIRSHSLPVAFLALVALLAAASRTEAQSAEEIRAVLFTLETESHQSWLEGNLAALDELMAEQFRFVAMNGAVETKADVVGSEEGGAPSPRPLQVRNLLVEPEQFALRGNVGMVISLLHVDATIRGRPLPPRMRVLSIFTRDEGPAEWRLTARSITPILAPPPEAGTGAETP